MAEKIKILQIITLSEWGGAQRVVFDLSCRLNKDKFLVEVASGGGGLLNKKLKEKGITVYEIPTLQREISFWKDWKTLWQLKRIIRKGKYDIVHCHSTKAGFLGRVAAKLSGVKKIYFTVHSWAFYNKQEYGKKIKFFQRIQKIGSLFSTKIICVSEKVKHDGLENKIAKDKKFQVIKNGIKFELKDSKNTIRQKMHIPKDKVIIIMTARLAHPKDPLLFLKASRIVKSRLPEAKFIVIGDGPLTSQSQAFISGNGLSQTTALLGEKSPEDARQLMKACDIFVLTSKFEGLPITIIEAMFAGLPVIASDVGGVGELVHNNKNGFLLKTQSPDELAERIIYLIENRSKAVKMGKQGRAMAEKNFSAERMVRKYEKLYLD